MAAEVVEMIEQSKETRNVDYKAPHAWDKDNFESKAGLTKDIMAFSNTQDGGTLIIGIGEREDGTGYDIEGLTHDQLRTYDISSVGSFVNERCEPAAKFDLRTFEYRGKHLIVIQISEFDSVPIVCKKDAQKRGGKDFIFKKGQIFIRTDDAKSKPIQSAEEMHKLLGLGITKKGDELLQSIQRIIRGFPIIETAITPEEMYFEEIEQSEEDFQNAFKDYEEYGFWDFVVYPLEYIEKRIDNHRELKDRLQEAKVTLRSRSFPYTRGEEILNVKNGIRKSAEYTTTRFYQIWRLYMSGYFESRQLLEEDVYRETDINSRKALDFTSTIYRATENLLFLKRFFEAIEYEGSIYYRILLGNSRDRWLRSLFDSKYHIDLDYACSQSTVEHGNRVFFDQFRSLWPEPCVDALIEIFALFNADRIPREMITKIVNDFLQRRF